MKCPICYSRRQTHLFDKTGINEKTYRIIGCSDCTHRYCDPIPTDQELSEIYQGCRPDYYRGGPDDYFLQHKAAIEDAIREALFVSRYVPIDETTRVLDFGCGEGFFVYACQRRKANVVGTDIDALGVEYGARAGLSLKNLSFGAFPDNFQPGEFDLIALREVIEHMRDPVRDVKMLAEYLHQGGFIMGHVPNGSGLAALVRKERWRPIIPPIHLHYFSEKSFGVFLEKCGFEPVFQGVFPTLASPDINLGLRRRIRQILGKAESRYLNRLGLFLVDAVVFIKRHFVYKPIATVLLRLNRGGRNIFFVARKR